jgi:adenine-specific DNA-methyltransferase
VTTNALDSLLGRIADPALQAAIHSEVDHLRDTKDFGLVFERHLPEEVRLLSHPIKRGVTVQERKTESDETWVVKTVKAGKATLLDADGVESVRPVEELVVIRGFGEPIYPGLKSVGKVERGGDKPFHFVINGENFYVLETLLYAYEGQVDCIYIDPPYNSGARDWKYNNDHVDGEDAYRHSKWLSFMEKRLRLAKRLLNPEDSVLIVTIDEKEYLRLGLLWSKSFRGA